MDTKFYNECKEIAERVIKQMMSTRQKGEIELLPYTPTLNNGFDPSWPGFHFDRIFDSWEEGDTAYVTTVLPGVFDKDMYITVNGNTRVWFNGIEIEGTDYPNNMFDGMVTFPVKFTKGLTNHIIFCHTASEKRFGFDFYLGYEYRMGWPGGFSYKTRCTIPFEKFYNQEGMAWSRIYKKGEALPRFDMDKIDWAGPINNQYNDDVVFDFNNKTTFSVASALTWVKGSLKITHNSPITVFADDEKIYSAASGAFEKSFDKKTRIIVEAEKTADGFGFKAEGNAYMPFYKTEDKSLSWLWIPVANLKDNVQFHRPYETSEGEVTFFFYRDNTYLRPYLNTTFFSQWFYAMMVGHYGLLGAAEKFDRPELVEYFKESIATMAKYYDFACLDVKRFRAATFLGNGAKKLDHLDPIGTIGMCVIDYLERAENSDPDAEKLLNTLESYLDNVPRTEMNSFYRIKTLWADDVFMSLPFLARLGKYRNDIKYFDEIVTQIKGFWHYLFMEDVNIFSHVYFPEEKKANRAPWGRGNGWVLLALSEVLLYMPKNHKDYNFVLEKFQILAKGILSFRGEKGMWHQVIDNHDTYEETSGTSMFIIAMARGVKNGWLDESFIQPVKEATLRMFEVAVDEIGNVHKICLGSGCHMDRKYYNELGWCTNDDHGVGILIKAAAEACEL